MRLPARMCWITFLTVWRCCGGCAGSCGRGGLYVEFPSVRRLGTPSARGTLQFCDDATHLRVYTVAEHCNVLMEVALVIRRTGRWRSWPRVALTPGLVTGALLRHGQVGRGCRWDVTGFADRVWAAREAGRLGSW